jgi:uncharacterized damage-inducible protein DinB
MSRPLVDALLPELDREATVTRKLLERIPEDQLEWKPHPKASSLGALATHIANLPQWGSMTIESDELDLDGAGVQSALASRAELLEAFDTKVSRFRATLLNRTDVELLAPWTLKHNGRQVFSMPKTAVLRSFVLNHLVHHRGQLSVYLRQLGVSLPAMYGPSADESPF